MTNDIEALRARIAELEQENAYLKRNPNYNTLTRQGLEVEHRKLVGSGTRYVVMLDIDHLHALNARFGSQEPVNELIRNAFSFRHDDLLLVGNYASGDEVAFVVRSDPKGFIVRLRKSLAEYSLSATMAWREIKNDDLLQACKDAIDEVYYLKSLRGNDERG